MTSWNGQSHLLQIIKTKDMRDSCVMKTHQLPCNIMEMSVKSVNHTAQVNEDPLEQEEGRQPSTETLCRTLELPQHMHRLYLGLGGGGHHW